MKMKVVIYILALLHIFRKSAGEEAATEGGQNANDTAAAPETRNDDIEDQGTLMRFTFADGDPFGPPNWAESILVTGSAEGLVSQRISTLGKRLVEKNNCKSNWMSPMNINTKFVTVPELGKQENAADDGYPETLIIAIDSDERGVQNEAWELGHPMENYNGIEIHSFSLGIMQLMDHFDPIGNTDPYITYDFHFLTLYYCDVKTAPAHRSMHQIDGKRFPLELHYVFLKNHDGNVQWYERDDSKPLVKKHEADEDRPTKGRSSFSQYLDGENIALVVVVLGEIGKTNRFFTPVVEAAKKFHGKGFENARLDDANNVVIKRPWSPSWLLPDASDYYYYDDGSFPVPPCWKVSRYYILRERIHISQEQLDALTNIKTVREGKGAGEGILACTHSILQYEILPTEVTLNLIEYYFQGDDHKPRTPSETRAWEARKKKMDTFRKRLKGVAVIKDEEEKKTGAAVNAREFNKNSIFLMIYVPFYMKMNMI